MNKSTIFTAAVTSGPFRHLKKDHCIVEENKRFVRLKKQKHLSFEPSKLEDVPMAYSFIIDLVQTIYSARHLWMSFVCYFFSGLFAATWPCLWLRIVSSVHLFASSIAPSSIICQSPAILFGSG